MRRPGLFRFLPGDDPLKSFASGGVPHFYFGVSRRTFPRGVRLDNYFPPWCSLFFFPSFGMGNPLCHVSFFLFSYGVRFCDPFFFTAVCPFLDLWEILWLVDESLRPNGFARPVAGPFQLPLGLLHQGGRFFAWSFWIIYLSASPLSFFCLFFLSMLDLPTTGLAYVCSFPDFCCCFPFGPSSSGHL